MTLKKLLGKPQSQKRLHKDVQNRTWVSTGVNASAKVEQFGFFPGDNVELVVGGDTAFIYTHMLCMWV